MKWLLILLLLPNLAHPMRLCWINPTQNVDGTALTNLAGISIYKDRLRLTTYAADGPGVTQCAIFRIPVGVYDFNATAISAGGDESLFSNTVRKIESRLGGPSGGTVLQGPSSGRVITEEN